MLAMATTTQTIVLMGGPCSGQTLVVPADCAVITAYDDAGRAHEYVRTELGVTPDDGGPPWVIFRRAPD